MGYYDPCKFYFMIRLIDPYNFLLSNSYHASLTNWVAPKTYAQTSHTFDSGTKTTMTEWFERVLELYRRRGKYRLQWAKIWDLKGRIVKRVQTQMTDWFWQPFNCLIFGLLCIFDLFNLMIPILYNLHHTYIRKCIINLKPWKNKEGWKEEYGMIRVTMLQQMT